MAVIANTSSGAGFGVHGALPFLIMFVGGVVKLGPFESGLEHNERFIIIIELLEGLDSI